MRFRLRPLFIFFISMSLLFPPLPSNVTVINAPTGTVSADVRANVTTTATQLPPTITTSPTEPATATPEPELVNPLKGKVFNQRCRVWDETDNTGKTTIHYDCVEKWAERPLPGGCSNQYKNYLGSSSCNLAATSFVINMLADPKVIKARVGKPYITPDVLAYDVYPNLPGGEGLVMDCSGASASTIKSALAYFGLESRDIGLSFYTVADKYRTIAPDELLMLSYIGINIRGKKFQHWNVASGITVLENGHETVTTHDSFFYADPAAPNYHTVVMEVSPNISPKSGSYTGKNYNIVGAMVVKKSEVQPDIQVIAPFDSSLPIIENLRNDPRFIISENTPSDVSYAEPIEVGEGRYRQDVTSGNPVSIYYAGEHDLMREYTFAFRWNGYILPLFQQDDPAWGGTVLKNPNSSNKFELFAKNGCAPTLLASILYMYPENLTESTSTPLDVVELIPGYRGKMFANDAKAILDHAGFKTAYTTASWKYIGDAIDDGKLVLIQSDVNFHWVGEASVTHYVLVLGKYGNGSFIIYDPLWGFATLREDILFQSVNVITISR